ncbi:MAG: sugar phosphate nucleotidyltransferase, partial [Oscillospiraceae bacterium]|nr:sugar phosphate nucleotidyltransferase [Oscillospiraceae bacterium]
LTQYQPLALSDYIGSGQPWDLDRMDAGVHILPPFQRSRGADWYKGTANAIYQNMGFIERYQPDMVLVLSGDHIYKMDYAKMIEYHQQKQADCTVAVIEVEMEEASRFGILNTRADDAIYEFEEKPEKPKSNLASMGIYVFNWQKLKKYLVADEADETSQNDFGKNVLPAMLAGGERMFAYRFEGYWKDVGTIDSLWEAHMDLLNPKVPLDLSDSEWKIYSRTAGLPPHYVDYNAVVENSMVCEGGEIYGHVDFSVLFAGVTVEPGADIRDSILMPGVTVKQGAKVHYAIVAENAVIGEDAHVGARPEDMKNIADWGVAVVAAGVNVGKGATVPAKAMMEKDVKSKE